MWLWVLLTSCISRSMVVPQNDGTRPWFSSPLVRSPHHQTIICLHIGGPSCFFKAVRACLRQEQHVGSVCKTSYSCKWRGPAPPSTLWLLQSGACLKWPAYGDSVCHEGRVLQSSYALQRGVTAPTAPRVFNAAHACLPSSYICRWQGGLSNELNCVRPQSVIYPKGPCFEHALGRVG